MEAPRMQCETFVLDGQALPSVEDLISASDPNRAEQLYREAGLELLAANVGPLRRAATAGRYYVGLSDDDYRTYAGYLSTSATPETCITAPADQALAVLIAARNANLFDGLLILSHPTTGESLLVGEVRSDTGNRYYKIAHWGLRLTSIAELRKQQRRRNRPRLRWPRLNFNRSGGRNWRRGSLYFGIVTVLAALVPLLLLPISWWLFMSAEVALMLFCGSYVAKRTARNSGPRWTVGWLIAAIMVASIVIGIVQVNAWYTTDRTTEVLVCDIDDTTYGDWRIDTSEGEMGLDPGFYNGVYHDDSSEVLARSMVGYWVRFTIHGYSLGDSLGGPYVTEATTLRTGSCA